MQPATTDDGRAREAPGILPVGTPGAFDIGAHCDAVEGWLGCGRAMAQASGQRGAQWSVPSFFCGYIQPQDRSYRSYSSYTHSDITKQPTGPHFPVSFTTPSPAHTQLPSLGISRGL